MAWLSGATALTKSIQQYGVDTIFTLPGAQLDPMFDALYQAKDAGRDRVGFQRLAEERVKKPA